MYILYCIHRYLIHQQYYVHIVYLYIYIMYMYIVFELHIFRAHLPLPSPAGPTPGALFLAEAILFPRLATDRMRAVNSSNPQNPVRIRERANS